MRLVVDASVLVGDLLRSPGRARLRDIRLDLFLPEETSEELRVEVPRRIGAFARQRRLAPSVAEQLTQRCLDAVATNVTVVPTAVYAAAEEEARARSVRDPQDWPLVACALAVGGAIWTNDGDLLGVGVPTWTTQTLQAWLHRHPDD